MKLIDRIWRDEDGAAAVEYAIISTLLIVVMLAIIELAFVLYQWQAAEKATIVGARKAAVVAPPASLVDFDGTGAGMPVGTPCMASGGGPIAACNFAPITCSGTACGAGWPLIFNEMRAVLPNLTAANVRITYAPNGLGFVGSGPLPVTITVQLFNYTYSMEALSMFEPIFSTTTTIPPSPATTIGESLGVL